MEHKNSVSGFKIFTISTTACSLIVVNFVFLHEPWYHPERYPMYYAKFFSFVYTFLYIMWTWAYVVTISANKSVPKSAMISKTEGRCEKCRISKPERTHHCSTCGICVEKMDHHCVWTDRCIGYRNYKSFLQFIGYLSIGTFVYDYLALKFLLSGNTEMNFFIIGIVYLETAIVLLTTLLANSLFIAHLLMASINLTTIEYMQGKPFKFWWNEENEVKNIHDMGPIQNFIQIFGGNPLTWLIPSLVNGREDGFLFPSTPEVNQNSKIKVIS